MIVGLIILFFTSDWVVTTILNRGLDNYFGLNQKSKILLIGHSHLMLATDKKMLEDSLGVGVSKYCREGVGVEVRDKMVKHFLSLPASDSLETVIYGVDQYMFNSEGLSANAFKQFYPFMDNAEIDAYVKNETDSKDYYIHKLIRSSRYSDALLNSAFRGWSSNWSNYKTGSLDIEAIRAGSVGKQLRDIKQDSNLKSIFESTLELITSRGIRVVLLNTPIIKEYNDAQPKERAEIMEYFKALADANPLIEYYDMNPEFETRYDMFYDPIHINNIGQPILTVKLIEYLRN